MNTFLTFIAGMVLGLFLGLFFAALLSANRNGGDPE